MRHLSPLGGRRLIAPVLGLLAAAALLTPALASADTSSTLTVIGTSDASDSGLMPNLIQPAFQKAFPQFTFKYIGTGTGTAVSEAESGAVGASVLMVHAASLENQFVANGYSYEKYGRAIFINDFVFAGPTGDPAGVAANATSNVAQAFADVASAGIAGKATFVSRGGTPGTTVEEHQIWALVQNSNLAPAGLLLCAVNSTSGGGMTPIAAGHAVTASGQPCPNNGALPTASSLPAWYVATGLTQGPNVIAANACTGHPSGANSCYVLSDRGTYDYLASGTDPAGSVPNLKILTRGPQSASAPGGVNALVNYFHAYIISPTKPGQAVNLTA
ncbi:MAG TPA: substrate-binding domain-containing protein, partial [Solirubrobacteraceae bacterium]|nr:substrate-binding domain-containing protein [Solirubrobacteraceae bacterium]